MIIFVIGVIVGFCLGAYVGYVNRLVSNVKWRELNEEEKRDRMLDDMERELGVEIRNLMKGEK